MIVKCPCVKNGQFCKKIGYLILESPRKKHVIRRWRYRNKKHKAYESTLRKRGSYYRVHHYIYDEYGRRKSKFHYLGNFDGALEKLKRVKKILEEYPSSKKTSDPIYDNDFIVSGYQSLKEIKDTIKTAERLDNFKKDPDNFAEIICLTIGVAQYYLIRGDTILRKYA